MAAAVLPWLLAASAVDVVIFGDDWARNIGRPLQRLFRTRGVSATFNQAVLNDSSAADWAKDQHSLSHVLDAATRDVVVFLGAKDIATGLSECGWPCANSTTSGLSSALRGVLLPALRAFPAVRVVYAMYDLYNFGGRCTPVAAQLMPDCDWNVTCYHDAYSRVQRSVVERLAEGTSPEDAALLRRVSVADLRGALQAAGGVGGAALGAPVLSALIPAVFTQPAGVCTVPNKKAFDVFAKALWQAHFSKHYTAPPGAPRATEPLAASGLAARGERRHGEPKQKCAGAAATHATVSYLFLVHSYASDHEVAWERYLESCPAGSYTIIVHSQTETDWRLQTARVRSSRVVKGYLRFRYAMVKAQLRLYEEAVKHRAPNGCYPGWMQLLSSQSVPLEPCSIVHERLAVGKQHSYLSQLTDLQPAYHTRTFSQMTKPSRYQPLGSYLWASQWSTLTARDAHLLLLHEAENEPFWYDPNGTKLLASETTDTAIADGACAHGQNNSTRLVRPPRAPEGRAANRLLSAPSLRPGLTPSAPPRLQSTTCPTCSVTSAGR